MALLEATDVVVAHVNVVGVVNVVVVALLVVTDYIIFSWFHKMSI